MSDDCTRFRERLERELAGAASARSGAADALRELALAPHALRCASCRELLAAEQELDLLLGEVRLPVAPTGLAERVLAELRAPELVAADPLDRLLGRAPEPRAPVGLAARVLRGFEPERLEARPRVHRGRRTRRRLQLVTGLAAAALLLALGLRALERPREEATTLAGLDPADREVVESLDVLEDWELLMGDDIDLLLSSLDVADELVLELELEQAGDAAEPAPEDEAPEPERG